MLRKLLALLPANLGESPGSPVGKNVPDTGMGFVAETAEIKTANIATAIRATAITKAFLFNSLTSSKIEKQLINIV